MYEYLCTLCHRLRNLQFLSMLREAVGDYQSNRLKRLCVENISLYLTVEIKFCSFEETTSISVILNGNIL